MTNDELSKKALEVFKEKGLDGALIRFHLCAKHFGAWKTNANNFEEYYNFGLEDISDTVQVTLKPSYKEVAFDVTTARFNGIEFKYGDAYDSISGEGSDFWCYRHVVFYIDDKLVISAVYDENERGGYIESDYKISRLEEFHYSSRLADLLFALDSAVQAQEVKKNQIDNANKEEMLENKFTFGD